jgi:hypothetical protein
MKKNWLSNCVKSLVFVIIFTFHFTISAQVAPQVVPQVPVANAFWKDVQFGGGLGLGIGSGYTNITVAPSGIYNFNKYVSLGLGLQYSYLKQNDFFSSSMYGGSVIGLFNPMEEIQLSVEVEELKVRQKFDASTPISAFWNTGLFLGAGYRVENVTIGARYNVLFVEDKGVYGEAFMPFVRVFF